MKRMLLMAMSQTGVALMGVSLHLEYPSIDNWGLGLFTGFFIGIVPVFYMALDNVKEHEARVKQLKVKLNEKIL